MAKCCVRGADYIYAYCEAHGLPVERVGKLICAPTADDAHHIETLYETGCTNGVKDLQIMTGEQVKELEPNVEVHSALYSPHTGIADFAAVSRTIAAEIESSPGSDVKVQFEVRDMNVVRGPGDEKVVQIDGAELNQKGPTPRKECYHVRRVASRQRRQNRWWGLVSEGGHFSWHVLPDEARVP
eukprot:CAMPEP_0206297500 /NCGR_PEP_ID=MMETSP0106_2-20121207/6204_1 /ASSEMBLY_ACC=CAM_ASM_000206 /TAXON_ID=81532 /ORGANISM="Acanthoeca-like sp., Strain 10tr" /LENGTH=183 /DNA_ID=CAMNT_0053728167 /DNA_START=11 /DNA_END=559 /DNA_ORIENTATION=-